MSSSTVITGVPQRGGNRYFAYMDGLATTKATADELILRWDLTDYLASGITVSSATWVDHGITSSSKSVSTPVVIGTVTGLGWAVITATLSNAQTVESTWYFLAKDGYPYPSDYGQ